MEILADKSVKCPATGFRKSCRSIVKKHTCPKWVGLDFTNPQTGEKLPRMGCSDTFIHMALVDNAKEIRQLAASVDKLATETEAAGIRVAMGELIGRSDSVKVIPS